MARDHLAFVTGATGFVGAAVARALAARGFPLRLLVRRASERKHLAGLEAELVEGDLNDADSLAHGVKDCRYVFHVAADYRIWVPEPDAMIATNVHATETLLRLAHAAAVERIIYTSSVAALGLSPRGGPPADEKTPITYEKVVGTYKKSKFLAEQVALRLSDEGVPIIIVNPAAPVGPGDVKPTPTGVMIRDAATGRMPAFVDTGLNFAHVDDVADGHLLAFDKGRIGERYILGGENLTLRAFLAIIAGLSGRKPPTVSLPIDLLMPLAYGAELYARLSGKEPFVTRDGLTLARKKMFFTIAKARRELGYTPRPAEDGIRDAIDWFRANNYLAR